MQACRLLPLSTFRFGKQRADRQERIEVAILHEVQPAKPDDCDAPFGAGRARRLEFLAGVAAVAAAHLPAVAAPPQPCDPQLLPIPTSQSMKFSFDLRLVTVIVAILTAWWIDHRRLVREIEILTRPSVLHF